MGHDLLATLHCILLPKRVPVTQSSASSSMAQILSPKTALVLTLVLSLLPSCKERWSYLLSFLLTGVLCDFPALDLGCGMT